MSYTYEDQPRSRLTSMSRYRDNRIITDTDTKQKFLESYQKKVIPTSPDDFFHEVKPEEERRLDLISYRYYQTPLLWWVIAEANNIPNAMVGPSVGDILRVPTITSLYGNGGILL